MEENKDLQTPPEEAEQLEELAAETPLDKNIKLMSPTRMVLRRFFRSKLSIVGLCMLIFLFLFCWLGPVVYHPWGETETDRTGATDYTVSEVEGTGEYGDFVQVIVIDKGINALAPPSASHLLGTDEQGMDIFVRLMYGGRTFFDDQFLGGFPDFLFRDRHGRYCGILRRGDRQYHHAYLRYFDVPAYAAPYVDYRYGFGRKRGGFKILHISFDGNFIPILMAGNGSTCPRTNSLPQRAGIYGRGGSDGVFYAEKDIQAFGP